MTDNLNKQVLSTLSRMLYFGIAASVGRKKEDIGGNFTPENSDCRQQTACADPYMIRGT